MAECDAVLWIGLLGGDMKRTEADKKRAEAFISILEGEVSLLREAVLEAIHWDRQSDVRAAVCRIRRKAEQLAESLDVPLPPGSST